MTKVKIKDARQQNYFIISNWVVDKEELSIYEKMIYIVLCRYADNQTSDCYPSLKTIAKKSDITKPTAIKYINKLIDKGYIKKTKRKKDDGGDYSNVYTIYNITPVKEINTPSKRDWQGGVKELNTKKTKKKKTKKKKESVPYQKIIKDLNKVAWRNFKSSTKSYQKLIKARRNEWYRLEDFKKIHRHQQKEWDWTKFEQYLVPSTLYRPSKFPKYIASANYEEKKKKKSASKKKKKKYVAKKEKKNTVTREEAKKLLNTNKNK